MKVLHSWLAEFVPGLGEHPVGGDPDALADVMSDIGLCCEEVVHLGGGLEGIVVAKVLELSPHPDADRIQLVQVDAGDGEALQVCCGAFNMAVGDLVPFATIGTTMPGGLEIARRKLRGEWSNGMLCSAAELELAAESSGIHVLAPDLPLGAPVATVLGIEPDALFDLDLTPNRPDALSVIGVARDVAARLGLAFVLPDIDLPESGPAAGDLVSVAIEDPGLCGRFTARVLSGVGGLESPEWLQRRLTLCGMRPISASVDVSNYVMLEYGQPNHTYDLASLPDGKLAVRRARAGERIATLDGVDRELHDGDGLVVDGLDRPVGLAGVMGGSTTEISDTTTDVLLELAWWDPHSIGASSKRHGLRSEASARFEKGVDHEIAERAAARVAELLVGMGATLHPGVVVARGTEPTPAVVDVRTARVSALLGAELTTERIRALVEPLGFRCEDTSDPDITRVHVPSWRPDATGEVDVVEEVARMAGYDSFGRTVPSSPRAGGLSDRQRDIRLLRDHLVAEGCSEAMPMPFLAPGELEASGVRADGVRVANPLVAEESVLRTSLLPGLVRAVGTNAAHRNPGVRLFEVGHCFAVPVEGELPDEWEELAVVLAGSEAPDAVGLALRLCAVLGVGDARIRNASVAGLHPGRSAHVVTDGGPIGVVGEIDPAVAERHGVTERVAYLSFTLGGDEPWHGGHGLLSTPRRAARHSPQSRMPSSDIDLAFVVPDDVAADLPLATMTAAGGELVRGVELFDVYRGSGVDPGSRSLAYRVRLQALDRTLTDAEVAEVRAAMIGAVEAAHGASLRG